jgi:hypothetical protein
MGQLTYACLMALNVANGEGLHIIFLKDMRLFAQVCNYSRVLCNC